MSTTLLHQRTIPSPTGPLTLLAGERGLRAVMWRGEDAAPQTRPGEAIAPGGSPVLDEAARQLDEYFAGTRRAFDLPLDPVGTPFQLAAWEALRAIPYGRTISYGEQAARLGDPNKARAVGAANGRNPLAIVVPCHRVIGSTGKLTGFGGGLDVKAWLLGHEQSGPKQIALALTEAAG